jgi:hypothetical protein
MRTTLIAPLVAATAIAALPATARADRSDCPRKLERSYSKHYRQVAHRHGKRAPGRNLRRWGVLFKGTVFDATCGEIRRSNGQLVRLLTAPPVMYSKPVPPPQPPAGVASDSNMAALPSCTWAPESGGSYGAYNSSSGAYGKYQVIPSTWAAHCSDLGRDPGGQEQCAARIWRAQGPGAWVGC